jgi:hypothetical protein
MKLAPRKPRRISEGGNLKKIIMVRAVARIRENSHILDRSISLKIININLSRLEKYDMPVDFLRPR